MHTDPPITKRQLGWIIILTGGLGLLAILAVDVIGAGQFAGLGPRQWQALGLAALAIVLGASLLPLGDRPA